ncbi:hypothetical protein EN813_028105 [Mesorhizobium sp. M00.F.Ca.ET.170.01.1.1]|nr:hypothetical protein EN813_028105 [Mesorhizobium sp. M00.F.Ca.ET.170.01.1.1]
MEYFDEVLDRKTGELVRVSKGEWITITEMAMSFGVGPRKARAILREMGVLQIEDRGGHCRQRLARWVVQRGWGKHLQPKGRYPFDVIGPEAQQWIAERWAETVDKLHAQTLQGGCGRAASALQQFKTRRLHPMRPQQEICWLIDHFPSLSQSEISSIVEVSQQLVSKFASIRQAQRDRWIEWQRIAA